MGGVVLGAGMAVEKDEDTMPGLNYLWWIHIVLGCGLLTP